MPAARRGIGALLAAGALAGAAHAATPLTAAKVVAIFKAQTGARLAVDPRSSYKGHYTALDLPASIGNIGRYGHFTIWLVTSGDEQDAVGLLSDVHTGVLGKPNAAGIYWEKAANVYGQTSWLAKKRFGAQLVLWWYGATEHTDATFVRLQRVLMAAARS